MDEGSSPGLAASSKYPDASDQSFFTVPPEMRKEYLERRQAELDALQSSASGNEWKYVFKILQHVRGTGGMFGFDSIGNAAEQVCHGIQNADLHCLQLMEDYIRTVREAYV
ncbi:MAG: Hpt domain-containing protein [Planctomycetota bacterium]|jgi:hypothetical protein|nr:Hpt domain-containing protein [Planctomycetota bacterium]